MESRFILKIFYFLCTFSFSGCQILPEPENFKTVYDIVLKNESGVEIHVKAYFAGSEFDNFVLKNNEQKINHFNQYSPSKGNARIPDSLKQNGFNVFSNIIKKFPDRLNENYLYGIRDSVIIIFDNKKAIIQKCDNYKDTSCYSLYKNLVFITKESNRVGKQKTITNWRKKENKTGPFVITLTKEDYDRAQ
jgi:hypothetical protein